MKELKIVNEYYNFKIVDSIVDNKNIYPYVINKDKKEILFSSTISLNDCKIVALEALITACLLEDENTKKMPEKTSLRYARVICDNVKCLVKSISQVIGYLGNQIDKSFLKD